MKIVQLIQEFKAKRPALFMYIQVLVIAIVVFFVLVQLLRFYKPANFKASIDTPKQELLQQLQTILPATKIDTVVESVIPGLYEITAGDKVLYLAENRYLVVGHIYDLHQAKDLTQERKASLPVDSGSASSPSVNSVNSSAINTLANSSSAAVDIAEKFQQLKHLTVEYGPADAPVIYVFSDPQCGFCQRMHKDLTNSNQVRVVELLYPILGGSELVAAQILCSADRVTALDQVMNGAVLSAVDAQCVTQARADLSASISLGRALNVQGTPTIFNARGEQQAGYRSIESLLSWLQQN